MANEQGQQLPATKNLHESLSRAEDLATRRKHSVVGLDHLLLALGQDPDALLILMACRVDVEALCLDLLRKLGPEARILDPNTVPPTFDLTVQNLIAHASASARESGRNEISGASIFSAIISGDGGMITHKILQKHGLTYEEALKHLNLQNPQETKNPEPATNQDQNDQQAEDQSKDAARALQDSKNPDQGTPAPKGQHVNNEKRQSGSPGKKPLNADIDSDALLQTGGDQTYDPRNDTIIQSEAQPSDYGLSEEGAEDHPMPPPPKTAGAPTPQFVQQPQDGERPHPPQDQLQQGQIQQGQIQQGQPHSGRQPIPAQPQISREAALASHPDLQPLPSQGNPAANDLDKDAPRDRESGHSMSPERAVSPPTVRNTENPPPPPPDVMPAPLPVQGNQIQNPGQNQGQTPGQNQGQHQGKPRPQGHQQAKLPVKQNPQAAPVNPQPVHQWDPAQQGNPSQNPSQNLSQNQGQLPGRGVAPAASPYPYSPQQGQFDGPPPVYPPNKPDHSAQMEEIGNNIKRSQANLEQNADQDQVVENIPKVMRVDKVHFVEVRVARFTNAELDFDSENYGLRSKSDKKQMTKAITVRLTGPDGQFLIDSASASTQWSELHSTVVDDADFAIWRWRVLPRKAGTSKLRLDITVRATNNNGLGAEIPVQPSKSFDIKITRNYGRIFKRLLIVGVLFGLGFGIADKGEELWQKAQVEYEKFVKDLDE